MKNPLRLLVIVVAVWVAGCVADADPTGGDPAPAPDPSLDEGVKDGERTVKPEWKCPPKPGVVLCPCLVCEYPDNCASVCDYIEGHPPYVS